MAREKELYRENLEILNTRYPNHDMLKLEEVMAVCGITSYTTAKKYFGTMMVNKRISKAAVARYMCG